MTASYPPANNEFRAWTWHASGEPTDLRLQRRSLLLPEAGEVLIANHMVGLNPVDWKLIGLGHTSWQPGHVPGVDGVGRIVAVGPGVAIPIGTRVAYHQDLTRDGSFAEFTRVRAQGVLPVPDDVSDELAASLPCPGLTACQALAKVPDVPDREVLITGAGGAVGLILTQLALQRGWRVWVTASSRHHACLADMGISGAFDYADPDWKERLQGALGARPLYSVFDTVSGAHARLLAPLLGYNGHLVCIQDRQEQAAVEPFTTAISLHEVALNSAHAHATGQDWQIWRDDARALFEAMESQRLRLPAHVTHEFEALPFALAELKRGYRHGKQLVRL